MTSPNPPAQSYQVDLPRVERFQVGERQCEQLLHLRDVGALSKVVVTVGLDSVQDLAVHIQGCLCSSYETNGQNEYLGIKKGSGSDGQSNLIESAWRRRRPAEPPNLI